MKLPLISCVVPVFNGECYLGETLDSILAQTYQPLEVIVVDDGSTDDTAAIANRYGQRVCYLWQSNSGEAKARDTGATAAQGEMIAFLDADDVWHLDKLSRQVTRLRERPEIDISFTRFKNFWAPELADEEKRYGGQNLSQVQTGWSISTFLASRSVFETYGSFSATGAPTRGAEAMIWYLRAADRGAVIDVLPEVLMYRRLHPTNQSRGNIADVLFPILKEWRSYQRQHGTRS